MENITGKELAGLLFSIHRHDSDTEEIIYKEEDLLPILKAIGLPEPEWGECLTLKQFLKLKKKSKNKSKNN